MFANAMYATGENRCRHRDPLDLRTVWQAMSGGPGGRGPGGSGASRGRGSRRHGGHRQRGFGSGAGFGGFPFGGSGLGGGPFGRGRGRKARRGDIRTASLLLLAEEPRNGYQIMQEVQERSDGVWRPSPGSVYPALQQLEDEGLIRSEETDGRKLFRLTDAGEAYLRERGDEQPAPWEQMSGDMSDQAYELGKLIREVWFAFVQVMRTGSDAQMAEARKVLVAARRDLYRILGDGDPASPIVEEDA
jgi:DNA-binding PadR family transcriptional regulator